MVVDKVVVVPDDGMSVYARGKGIEESVISTRIYPEVRFIYMG